MFRDSGIHGVSIYSFILPILHTDSEPKGEESCKYVLTCHVQIHSPFDFEDNC